MTLIIRLVVLGILVFGVCGCGKNAPTDAGATVNGSVTFDGKPVENGVVMFTTSDRSEKPIEGVVSAGKYTIAQIPPGKRKATVQGYSGTAGSTGEPLFPPNVPGSSREVEIKPGPQTVDFVVSLK